MFQPILQKLVQDTPAGLAAVVMDMAGIALESFAVDGAPLDAAVVGAEFSVIMKAIANAASMLEAGQTAEVAVQTTKFSLVLRPLSESYYLALAAGPETNLGKAKYLARLTAPAIASQL
jgi:predicted regulator of Ras-like GTPase activity (Roadblock/LC7/MglB family)